MSRVRHDACCPSPGLGVKAESFCLVNGNDWCLEKGREREEGETEGKRKGRKTEREREKKKISSDISFEIFNSCQFCIKEI